MPHRQFCFVLLLETTSTGNNRRWSGTLVTGANQRLRFSTLAQLDQLLVELADWQDPLDATPAPDESRPG